LTLPFEPSPLLRRLLSPVVWMVRLVVFVGLFGLAIKNSGPVELRFYFEQLWVAPVSAVVLISFAIGVLVGLTAVAGRWLGQRWRER
jgi:uncharacterized integral membrane protein